MKKSIFIFLIISANFLGFSIKLHSLESNPDYWSAEEYYYHSSSQKDSAADLLRYVPIEGNETILDVGCGDGKITAELSTKLPGGFIIGLDISSSMIDFAKRNYPLSLFKNLSFVRNDAQNINYHNEFDIIFSFTALQWIQNHDVFLKRTYQALTKTGILAITMPTGLPRNLKLAVDELIATEQWSSYFQDFITGWNFVDDEIYSRLLDNNGFVPLRLKMVPQKDVFETRKLFEKFISQWFPYLRPLPEELKKSFLTQVIDRFLELEKTTAKEVHFNIRRLEVVAIKKN